MSNPDPRPTRSDELVGGRVRRSPRYGAFLVLGALLGVVVALILTFAYDGTSMPSDATNVVFSEGQVFGFLSLILGSIGALFGGIVALVLDRTVGRRTRSVVLDHETVENPEARRFDQRDAEPIVLNQVDTPTPVAPHDQRTPGAAPTTTPPDAPRR
jgi:uncharacterized membrane protein YdjX (TVP38/TMEM64 family)